MLYGCWQFDHCQLALIHTVLPIYIAIDSGYSVADVIAIVSDLAAREDISNADLGCVVRALEDLTNFLTLGRTHSGSVQR